MHQSPKEFSVQTFLFQGQLVGVIGRVGSGKSSLLSAFLAEMCRCQGQISVQELDQGFALASQEAWIQNASVRDNILFNQKYDPVKYDRVVKACALVDDFKVIQSFVYIKKTQKKKKLIQLWACVSVGWCVKSS